MIFHVMLKGDVERDVLMKTILIVDDKISAQRAQVKPATQNASQGIEKEHSQEQEWTQPCQQGTAQCSSIQRFR